MPSRRVQLFSGGEEAVLVQWNLSKGTKAFLPRLGAPLQVSEHPIPLSPNDPAVALGYFFGFSMSDGRDDVDTDDHGDVG